MSVKRSRWVMAVALFVICAGTLSIASAQERLTGTAAWNQVVGNSITGEEDGQTLVEYYAPDGTVKSMHGNDYRPDNGRSWARLYAFATPETAKPNVTSWR
jgi:hypothetical protein